MFLLTEVSKNFLKINLNSVH